MTMSILTEPLFGETDGYDGEGYDADGYDRSGYNKDGYDRDGFDRDGRDADGYDREGYDEDDLDRDGKSRYLDPGDLELRELWQGFRYGDYSSQRRFLAHLRVLTNDSDEIDDVVFCWACGNPEWRDETDPLRGNSESRVCGSCREDFATCSRCEDLYPSDEVRDTLDDADICDHCVNHHYSYCDECEGYYNPSSGEDHRHDDSCCTSPALEFTLRNDGCEPLANDTRAQITLPKGTIDAEGLAAISGYLATQSRVVRYGDYAQYQALYSLAYDLEALGDQWQGKRGNYAKRLSQRAYEKYTLKLSQEIMSQVGVIARDHSNQISVTVAATRDLNMSARDFYHSDSCWWGSYGYSRCTLKTNGGFGLRSFNEHGDVSGRAWVFPLRKTPGGGLTPTFDTVTPDAFMVFNGYGQLSGYTAPRLLAHMAGWTYRKTNFHCEPMYVNSGGYLVAPEDIAQRFASYGVSLSLDKHSPLFETEQAVKARMAAEEAAKLAATVQLTITEKEMADVSA